MARLTRQGRQVHPDELRSAGRGVRARPAPIRPTEAPYVAPAGSPAVGLTPTGWLVGVVLVYMATGVSLIARGLLFSAVAGLVVLASGVIAPWVRGHGQAFAIAWGAGWAALAVGVLGLGDPPLTVAAVLGWVTFAATVLLQWETLEG